MESLGVAPGHPEQSRHGIFGYLAQAGGGTDSAPFAQMINNGLSIGLRDLRVAQRGATSLRELLTARPTAQEPDVVLTVYFAYRQIVLARETKPLAFRVDTR